MSFIILFLISVASMFVFGPIAKKTKIPLVLFFIVFGILFSTYGIYNLFGAIDNINPNISALPMLSTYAVIILFLVSGLGLNINAVKKSGKSTLILSSLPVFVEGLIMGVVSFLIFQIFPISMFSFSIWGFMTVMIVFAMSSPAIIIPITMQAKASGKKSKLFDQMSVASVLDNFLPFPLLLIFYILATSVGVGVAGASVSSVLIQVIVMIIAVIIAYIIGHVFGYILAIIASKLKLQPIIYSILLIIGTIILVIITGPIGASLGLMIGFGVGIGFNIKSSEIPEKQQINTGTSKIYGLLLMPLIFIYVGSQIQINLLFNPVLVILLAIITIIAIAIKGGVSKFYLKSQGYTLPEQKLSGTLFAAKGTILINISLVLSKGLEAANLGGILQYMYILAAISIIISVPYSIIASQKQIEKI